LNHLNYLIHVWHWQDLRQQLEISTQECTQVQGERETLQQRLVEAHRCQEEGRLRETEANRELEKLQDKITLLEQEATVGKSKLLVLQEKMVVLEQAQVERTSVATAESAATVERLREELHQANQLNTVYQQNDKELVEQISSLKIQLSQSQAQARSQAEAASRAQASKGGSGPEDGRNVTFGQSLVSHRVSGTTEIIEGRGQASVSSPTGTSQGDKWTLTRLQSAELSLNHSEADLDDAVSELASAQRALQAALGVCTHCAPDHESEDDEEGDEHGHHDAPETVTHQPSNGALSPVFSSHTVITERSTIATSVTDMSTVATSVTDMSYRTPSPGVASDSRNSRDTFHSASQGTASSVDSFFQIDD